MIVVLTTIDGVFILCQTPCYMLYNLDFYPQSPREAALPFWRRMFPGGRSALPLSGLLLSITCGPGESGAGLMGGELLVKEAWLSYSFSHLPAQGPGIPL